MEEKESTVSGSLGNSETDSPPPVTSVMSLPLTSMATTMNMASDSTNMDRTVNATTITPNVVSSGGSGDLSGKKKRGRPRKYDADGNLRVQYPFHHAASAVHGGAGALLVASSPGFTITPSSPPPPSYDHHHGHHQFFSSSNKRGRGRPRGSGNWQLLASLGELFANTAGGDFTPHVITVNTGEDVAGKILSFSQKGPRGICVLSANGAVSNVTIRQPGSSGGILTYEGRFEILSLTGSYTVIEHGGARSRTGGLSVSLASSDGRVIGGGVAGLLLAASPIQIVVGSFMPNGFKAHKRKYYREQTVASGTPDTVTAAAPISQAKPDGETCLTPVTQLPARNHGGIDISSNEKQMLNDMNSHGGFWNGASNQGPSPDINLSAPSEEDVQGVL